MKWLLALGVFVVASMGFADARDDIAGVLQNYATALKNKDADFIARATPKRRVEALEARGRGMEIMIPKLDKQLAQAQFSEVSYDLAQLTFESHSDLDIARIPFGYKMTLADGSELGVASELVLFHEGEKWNFEFADQVIQKNFLALYPELEGVKFLGSTWSSTPELIPAH